MPTPNAASHRAREASSLQRVTVNLTARSVEALEQAVKLTRDSQTNTINRANFRRERLRGEHHRKPGDAVRPRPWQR